MSIGTKIKVLRKQNKLTQVELSKKANMSRSYLADVENDRYNPSLEVLKSIANALGVPHDYLLAESAKALIEDKIKINKITIEELVEKANIPIAFMDNLDNIIPTSEDYEYMERIAHVIGINSDILKSALYKQEPPTYDGPITNGSDDFGVVKEESTIEKDFPTIPERFTNADMARAYVMKHQIFAASGFYPERMSDEDILNFANEMINQAELISYKYKNK